MGVWAGIKYALNSTVGTEGFAPLDKLIDDKVNTVLNQRQASLTGVGTTVYSSNNVISLGRNGYHCVVAKFTAPIHGIYTVDCTLRENGTRGASYTVSAPKDITTLVFPGDSYATYCNKTVLYDNATIGEFLSISDALSSLLNISADLRSYSISPDTNYTFKCSHFLQAGERFLLCASANGATSSVSPKVTSVVATYQGR